jgi:ribose transport system substrate-binding protein
MKPKIVVSLLTSNQDYQRMQAADAQTAAQGAGLGIEVVFAENNAIQQIQQLYRFLRLPEGERPVAILVEAVSRDGLERIARSAVKAGIGWVAMQTNVSYLASLHQDNPKVPVVSVTADEEEISRLQARQFRALLPKGGTVLYLQGPLDSAAAQARFEGMQREIQGSGIEVGHVLNGDWTEPSAETTVAGWLRLKTTESVHIDLVGAQNDSMAAGARKAIASFRKEWTLLPFTGCDGLPDGGQRMVNTQQLAATIVKPTTAGPAVDLIARTLKGHTAPSHLVLPPRSFPPIAELAPKR